MNSKQIYSKIADIVVGGVKPTQMKLCHANTATWVKDNLEKVNYKIALWGEKETGDVFHSGVLSPENNIVSSKYAGVPKHSLNSKKGLELPNNVSLDLLDEITVLSFISDYLEKLYENTTTADLDIGLPVVGKEDHVVNKNKRIYNEPDLGLAVTK
jgi:hypothetical protein